LRERTRAKGKAHRLELKRNIFRRIEGGIFNWGADMTYENNPLEMGMERLVDWNLRDEAAISMPALRRIRAQGIRRKINGIEFDGDPFPALNYVKWPISAGGQCIGKVTSAIHSPRLRKNIGYGWLPLELSKPGTQVTVDSEWGSRTGVVVEMPFVDPQKRIPVG
jgi:glycine cleavage system aminomethyltransferase T